jgi:hypothetical protein
MYLLFPHRNVCPSRPYVSGEQCRLCSGSAQVCLPSLLVTHRSVAKDPSHQKSSTLNEGSVKTALLARNPNLLPLGARNLYVPTLTPLCPYLGNISTTYCRMFYVSLCVLHRAVYSVNGRFPLAFTSFLSHFLSYLPSKLLSVSPITLLSPQGDLLFPLLLRIFASTYTELRLP